MNMTYRDRQIMPREIIRCDGGSVAHAAAADTTAQNHDDHLSPAANQQPTTIWLDQERFMLIFPHATRSCVAVACPMAYSISLDFMAIATDDCR